VLLVLLTPVPGVVAGRQGEGTGLTPRSMRSRTSFTVFGEMPVALAILRFEASGRLASNSEASLLPAAMLTGWVRPSNPIRLTDRVPSALDRLRRPATVLGARPVAAATARFDHSG
jgi:hypothetical protein